MSENMTMAADQATPRRLLVRGPSKEHGDEYREMTEEEIRVEVEDGELLIDEDTDELIDKDHIPESTEKIRRQRRVSGG